MNHFRSFAVAAATAIALLFVSSVALAGDATPSSENLLTNQRAAMSYVDSLAPDMPVAMQKELRGSGFLQSLYWAYKKSAPVRLLWNSYQSYDVVGWEIGRWMAINNGLPDPGPVPNQFLMQRVIYAVADGVTNLYYY